MTSLAMARPVTKLSQEQASAIALCCDLQTRIAGVTGGAGTGKTVVLGRAYKEMKSLHHSCVLCAPTGRAAKRIQELTKIPAVTIHKLLEFPQPGEEGDVTIPGRDNGRRIEQRVVFVDEASMIGTTLYDQLLSAMPNNGVIRFFGDNNQLPPVESGEAPFLKVLTNYPHQVLTFNYRSDDEIVSNAGRILRGSIPQRNARFDILYSDDPIATVLEAIPAEYSGSSHQIIVPTRNGNFGTRRMNPSLQLKFNPTGDLLRLDRLKEDEAPLAVRASDKFLWVKNDYNLKLSNGETGNIEWIDTEDGSLGIVTGDGTEVEIPAFMKTYSAFHGHMIRYDPRRQLELGYAVTTHKSQGSEFESIFYVITRQHAWMLNRRNFYTAITRAKKKVTIVCDRRSMALAVRPYKDRR